MKAIFSKWWPTVMHVAAVGIIFLAPSVQTYIGSHPALSAMVAVAWGAALHWAQSPKA